MITVTTEMNLDDGYVNKLNDQDFIIHPSRNPTLVHPKNLWYQWKYIDEFKKINGTMFYVLIKIYNW